jgi:MFS family permease
MLVGTFAGPVYDMGFIRQLMAVGSFLIVFGQMMLSLSSEYWHVLLAQGFSIGIGTGCIFVSGVAILSTHFSTRLATATGVAATGSSIGGMLYPIIFYKLQPRVGFAWATRSLGFLALGTLLISNILLRIRVKPVQRRKFLDLPAWRELPYLFFNL